jgi:hypothetical protein
MSYFLIVVTDFGAPDEKVDTVSGAVFVENLWYSHAKVANIVLTNGRRADRFPRDGQFRQYKRNRL